MPRVSQVNLISENELNKMLQELSDFMVKCQNSTSLLSFLNVFLTHEEKIMLGKRLALYKMLEKGYSVDDVKDGLQVSYETARSYKLRYDSMSQNFKNEISSSLKTNSGSNYFKKLDNALNAIIDSRHDMKARSKLMRADFEDK